MMNTKPDELPPVLIPPESLGEDILNAILESFILREGTDYGLHEISVEQKLQNLKKRLDKNEAVLVFDPNTESVTFLTQKEWGRVSSPKTGPQ